jgi:hypothetical protein
MIFSRHKISDQRQPAPPATQASSPGLASTAPPPKEAAQSAHSRQEAIWASRSKRIAAQFLDHVRQQQSVPSQARRILS